MSHSIHIIYAYYEKNVDYRRNLIYFLVNGYLPTIDYTIVINGQCTIEIPQKDNIHVIFRENTGYDFQGYYQGILSLNERHLLQPFHHYLFINNTVCGPFLPSYTKNYLLWYQPFLDLLIEPVKLVGSTINVTPSPHVQSYLFLMNYECLHFLLEQNFFKMYTEKEDVITFQEILMSHTFLQNGWNISCLIPEYQKIDYRQQEIPLIKGDIRLAQSVLGRRLSPYEVIFVKTSWKDITSRHEYESLIQFNLPYKHFQKRHCSRILYGLIKEQAFDVTKIIKKKKKIHVNDLLLNQLFGDPSPNEPKHLYVFLRKENNPLILNELNGYLTETQMNYTFVYENENLFLITYRYDV